MTIRLSATVICDECYEVMVVDESDLHARNAELVAGDRGWGRDTEGNNWCPPCTAKRREKKAVRA